MMATTSLIKIYMCDTEGRPSIRRFSNVNEIMAYEFSGTNIQEGYTVVTEPDSSEINRRYIQLAEQKKPGNLTKLGDVLIMCEKPRNDLSQVVDKFIFVVVAYDSVYLPRWGVVDVGGIVQSLVGMYGRKGCSVEVYVSNDYNNAHLYQNTRKRLRKFTTSVDRVNGQVDLKLI